MTKKSYNAGKKENKNRENTREDTSAETEKKRKDT